MGYVVYVNHPTNKAIVHATECGKYRSRRRDKTLSGFWSIVEINEFETKNEAMQYAKKTGKKNIDTCAFCIKE